MHSFATPLCVKPFVDGLKAGEIRYQFCSRCQLPQSLSRYRCLACGSKSLQWKQSTGLGEVEALTDIGRASDPAFQALVPYAIVLVCMREGFRLMAIQDPESRTRGPMLRIGDGVMLSPRLWGQRIGLLAKPTEVFDPGKRH